MSPLDGRKIDELITAYLPERIKNALMGIGSNILSELEEIRIRAEQPLMGVFADSDRFIGIDGSLSDDPRNALIVTYQEIREIFYLICDHSVYAYQEDIVRGFITIKGGHRVGICGSVLYEGDQIKGMKDISSLNIRLSREHRGCANSIFGHVVRGQRDIYNTLILSPPRCGKTTILRDLCRLISQGGQGFYGLRTAVIDERSELAANYRGIPQNDLGPRTDILDGCRKSEGIEMVLRGMAPHVIVVDELGGARDAQAVRLAWNAGVRLIATAHAFGPEDFKKRPGVGQLAGNDGFERIILLGMDKGKRWARVMDANENELDFLVQNAGSDNGFRRMYEHGTKPFKQAGSEAACTC